MKMNVVFNKAIPEYKSALAAVENCLLGKRIDFCSYELGNMDFYGDFTIVIGGDGTLLRAAKFYSHKQIPVLGINLGRLGFLSQADVEEIKDVIEEIIMGNYYTESRLMLCSENNLALNDFVIKGSLPSRTSKFYLEINDREVCDYIADGLIISTPTGSTAYGLSAGGPVLHPLLDGIVIVPICPHTLNSRPLVIPSGEKITVKSGDFGMVVAVDGVIIDRPVEKIKIMKCEHKALLTFLNNNRFYNVLRNKLDWGVSRAK